MRGYAAFLLVLGLLQMAGDLAGQALIQGIAAATAASPAPRVFSSVGGLETYSTRFWIEWKDARGSAMSLELTPEVAARLRGPYNRRNVFGAALAYGPVLVANKRTRAMLGAVLAHGLLGDAPLLVELGVDVEGIHDVALRYAPRSGSSLGDLPTRIEVPLAP
jgi:hypothetical protein